MLTETEAALGTTWMIDPERSTVTFIIAHFGVATVEGRFGAFTGTLAGDRDALQAKGTVEPATVDTGNALRDRSLRGAEYFDVGRHPEIGFASTRIERLGTDALRITGDLTIKETTREAELHGRLLAATPDRLEMLVTADLNRADFGLDSLELSAAGVSKRVKLRARLSLAR
jgi:polyisoprenoid-binding protein YceI